MSFPNFSCLCCHSWNAQIQCQFVFHKCQFNRWAAVFCKNTLWYWSKNWRIAVSETCVPFVSALQERCVWKATFVRPHHLAAGNNKLFGESYSLSLHRVAKVTRERDSKKTIYVKPTQAKIILRGRPWFCKQDACCLDLPSPSSPPHESTKTSYTDYGISGMVSPIPSPPAFNPHPYAKGVYDMVEAWAVLYFF